MSILGSIVLGLISGFVVSKLIYTKGNNLVVDIVLGMIGALVGGFIFMKADVLGITTVMFDSMVVSILGSLLLLFVYHKLIKH